jgi:hypothetical protein
MKNMVERIRLQPVNETVTAADQPPEITAAAPTGTTFAELMEPFQETPDFKRLA